MRISSRSLSAFLNRLRNRSALPTTPATRIRRRTAHIARSARLVRSVLLPVSVALAFALSPWSGGVVQASAAPGVLTYVASPATKETRVTLSRRAGRIVIIDDFSGAVLMNGRADLINHVIVRGVDGNHNDTLTVDFSGGLSLPGGIDFDGGRGGFDSLRITGHSRAASRHIPTNRSDGAIQLGTTEIRYRNLEPVIDTIPSPTLTINFPAGTVGAILQDNGGKAEIASTNSTFESITFANKGSVDINGGGGADTLTLAADVWADLTVPVTVHGSGSSNTLVVDLTGATSPSLPVTNTSGNLSGTWTFGNRPTLTFSDIQSLNPAALSVSVGGPASVNTGANISYTITVNNAGPNSAAGLTVTDVLPSNTTFVSASPSQGSCGGTGTLTCSLGLIGSGGSATITLVLQVNSGTTVSDTASVTSATTDTNASNSSTSNATVLPAVVTPALSTWGLAALGAMLAGFGVLSFRRTRAAKSRC